MKNSAYPAQFSSVKCQLQSFMNLSFRHCLLLASSSSLIPMRRTSPRLAQKRVDLSIFAFHGEETNDVRMIATKSVPMSKSDSNSEVQVPVDELEGTRPKRKVESPMKEKVVGKVESPTPTKKAKSPRKPTPKIEAGSLKPPKGWLSIYTLVEELRADKTAPVDAVGAEALPERIHGEKVFRFQVLIALMLSSQTKDAIVGETMKKLQKHGLTPENIRNTSHDQLNELIFSVGFRNNKTKFIKSAVEIIIDQYDGDIPPTVEELMKLPGVGPKMAYLVENIALNKVTGIGVDTHMHRIFNQLNWVSSTDPEKTREQLEGWLPQDKWRDVNYIWVGFGQEIQQQTGKLLGKALRCSRPKEALNLLKRLKVDCKREAEKIDLLNEYNAVVANKRQQIVASDIFAGG